MKNVKPIIVIVALVATAFMVQPVLARVGGQDWGGFYNSLTPEKQQAVTRMVEENRKQMFELRQNIWAKQTELQAAVSAQNPDQKTVKQLTGEVVALQDQMYTQQQEFHAKLEKETGYDFSYANCPGANFHGYGNHGFQNGHMGGRGGHGYGHMGGYDGHGYGHGYGRASGCPGRGYF